MSVREAGAPDGHGGDDIGLEIDTGRRPGRDQPTGRDHCGDADELVIEIILSIQAVHVDVADAVLDRIETGLESGPLGVVLAAVPVDVAVIPSETMPMLCRLWLARIIGRDGKQSLTFWGPEIIL